MAYRCVATSAVGFLQQLAVAYVANGYWFYVTGRVPAFGPGAGRSCQLEPAIDRVLAAGG